MPRFASRAVYLAWLCVLAGSVVAGQIQVSPVLVAVEAPAAAGQVSLTNGGTAPLTMQVRLFGWDQQNGEDAYHRTGSVVASPPILTIAPGQTSVVRLVRLEKTPPQGEEAYRLIIDELPNSPVVDKALDSGARSVRQLDSRLHGNDGVLGLASTQNSVIPAQAGIQTPTPNRVPTKELDSRVRGNDEVLDSLLGLEQTPAPALDTRGEGGAEDENKKQPVIPAQAGIQAGASEADSKGEPAAKPVPRRAVTMLIRYSIPVFFLSAQVAAAAPVWRVIQGEDEVRVQVTNRGQAHLKLSALAVRDEQDNRISFGEGLIGYVLGGRSREFTRRSEQPLTGTQVQVDANSNIGEIKETAALQHR